MPNLRGENIKQYTGNYSFSPVRMTHEPRAKIVENIQSMMNRFKDYTETMGSLRKCSLGISRTGGVILLEDFCTSIENFITDTLNSEPYKTVIHELNQYFMRKISYQINHEKIMESFNLHHVTSIIPLVDEYVNNIYKGKKIQQGDRFKKSAIIINILYSMLLADYVVNIRANIKKNDTDVSYLWRTAYEIGFLQGEMCLIESHLDPDMIDIHHRSIASQAKSKDWKVKHAVIKEMDKILDHLYEKPLEYAEAEWKKRREIIYHNKMAKEIMESPKFKKLELEESILVGKLRPLAKKYRYSDFSEGEFKSKSVIIREVPKNITLLCSTISRDNYRMQLNLPENTIGWLNEIVTKPDFYSKWFKRKGEIDLSPELNKLIGDTHGCRKKKFSELTEEEQGKIKRLNRLLLEQTYPSITPKSLKHGLMRGWKGKKKEE